MVHLFAWRGSGKLRTGLMADICGDEWDSPSSRARYEPMTELGAPIVAHEASPTIHSILDLVCNLIALTAICLACGAVRMGGEEAHAALQPPPILPRIDRHPVYHRQDFLVPLRLPGWQGKRNRRTQSYNRDVKAYLHVYDGCFGAFSWHSVMISIQK